MHKTLSLVPLPHGPVMVVQVYNPTTWKTKAKEEQARGSAWLHSELEAVMDPVNT